MDRMTVFNKSGVEIFIAELEVKADCFCIEFDGAVDVSHKQLWTHFFYL